MLDVFGLTPVKFETLLLVAIRVTMVLNFIPVFSALQIPLLVRVGFGLLLSFVVYTMVPTIHYIPDLYGLALAVLQQFIVAALFGFVVSLVFMGVQLAGEILDIQVGFAIANVLNPFTNQNVSLIGEFQLAIATLLFLVSDAHLLVIEALGSSFQLLPLPGITLAITTVTSILHFLVLAFVLVFKIAGPVVLAIFVTNIMLGLMARAAPQMNVFVVGFPLQVGIGLTFIAFSLPLLGYILPDIYNQLPRELNTVLSELSGH